MAAQSVQIRVAKKPIGDIIPSEIFKTEKVPTPSSADLKDGQVLIETLYVSLDPAMRFWLDGGGYMNLEPGHVMPGPTLVRILASRAAGLKAGDFGLTWEGRWRTQAIIEASQVEKKDLIEDMRLTDAIGFLGPTGLTGYFGMIRDGKPKNGETVVVSTAAGATGSIAAQTAKALGCRVVGITGSKEKCDWLYELGLDAALNYRAPDFEEQFAKALPGGIDVYFDNVGGKMLEMSLNKLNKNGRIAICGDISSYNSTKPYGLPNYFELALRNATMQGVNIFEYMPDADEGRAQLLAWAREGKLKRTETIVKGSLEDAPAVLVDLFEGKNTGKMLLELKRP